LTRPRVVVLRGHHVNPWDLRPFEELDLFDVTVVVTGSNVFSLESLSLTSVRVRALSDFLPIRRVRTFWAGAPFNHYLGLGDALEGADIVHAAELGTWFTADAARNKAPGRYGLVATVWETIPFRDTYRRRATQENRALALAETDLFLATTERARSSLLLEGVPAERIAVSAPGVDIDRFSSATAEPSGEHMIVSPGRLVWEKGHQDVLRALATLRSGLVAAPEVDVDAVRLLVVGSGPEERSLRRYAHELALDESVEFRASVPYDQMPAVYAAASCMVLASLPTRQWEEQFGMVLAEAMAAGLPIVASSSGAIPEVAGAAARYFAPGDWLGLARELAEGPLSRPPGTRVEYPSEHLAPYSSGAAAERLADAYERVLSKS
jgi:glycosyltransferase involved in cell wall biosynthesis